MRTIKISVLAFASLFTVTVSGQEVVRDVVNATNQANNANKAANSVANTITNTKNAVVNVKNALGGLAKKKKKSNQSDNNQQPIQAKTTIISIAGVDYSGLKTLEESIKALEGVESTKKTFVENQSTLEVAYRGDADELWDLVAEALKNSYTLKSINGQKIDLEFKK